MVLWHIDLVASLSNFHFENKYNVGAVIPNQAKRLKKAKK